jgi:hypothetical protein
MEFYYKLKTVPKASGFYIYKTMYLKDLPIRCIDFDKSDDKKLYDDLVALVKRMLELNKKLVEVERAWEDRKELEKETKRTDEKIDRLVYELYELTEEEMRIIDNEVRRPEAPALARSLL